MENGVIRWQSEMLDEVYVTLAEALTPVGIEEFLRDYLGERYVLIKGHPKKFHHLVTWDRLDDVLSRVRVSDNRVFLVRQAQNVARESYVQTSRTGTAQYLRGHAVAKHVADGATLVVTQVDELIPQVRQLAESCEKTFQIYVAANLYAGWRTDNGFDVHWDGHDTLIIQVIGRKNWKVWKPTRLHPVVGDRDMAEAPTQDPVYEGVLEDGDVLYMPRGWWHVAYPRDEPSLHLTFGLRHPTGLDLLGWVCEDLRGSVAARMDVPHWRGAADRATWVRAIGEALASSLSSDAIERYMQALGEQVWTRPIVRLPRDPITMRRTLSSTTLLRLSSGRRLYLKRGKSAEQLSFAVRGVNWCCDEGLAPALGLLDYLTPCTLADMARVTPARAISLVQPFVTALVAADVVWDEPAQDEYQPVGETQTLVT
jgi:ribosomal protein L16 Arg81 hydroxylase